MALDTALHLDATQMFIDENPTTITRKRRTLESDGAGGWRWSTGPTTDVDVVVRLVGLNLQTARSSVVTVNGQEVTIERSLIALPSAPLAVGDQFTVDGKLHEIAVVDNHPEWRLRAEVFLHA